MKETLYSIPVNDAFSSDCECPICSMFKKLEDDAVDYTMGPSYMEDDTRAQTDALGFCDKHIRMVYAKENRLGMAWVMKTHFDKTIRDVKKNLPSGSSKLMKKGAASLPVIQYLDRLNSSCFVCSRINNFFDRYIDTVFYLWKSDMDFRSKFKACKGFCSEHYAVLIKRCAEFLRGSELDDFVNTVSELYISNMERVRDDLAWFINKFDYNYNDEPWYNAKDSVIRSMIKTNGVFIE